VEIFFKIDINSYTSQGKLSELENLTFSEVQNASQNYLPICVPTGAFYLALDSKLQWLFVLFSNLYLLLLRSRYGKKSSNQVPKIKIKVITKLHSLQFLMLGT